MCDSLTVFICSSPTIQPYASYFLYHPRLGTVDSQFENDFHAACCGNPTLGICDVYYSRRILNRSCSRGQSYTLPTRGKFSIDPLSSLSYLALMTAWSIDGHHIRTFDGIVYTFNGIGEFSLLENDNIRLQIRTRPTLYHAGVTDVVGFAVSFYNTIVRV